MIKQKYFCTYRYSPYVCHALSCCVISIHHFYHPPHSKKKNIYIPLYLLLPICKFSFFFSLFYVGCLAIFRWLVNFCCIYYFRFRLTYVHVSFHLVWFSVCFFCCHFRLFFDLILHCRAHCWICVNLWQRFLNILSWHKLTGFLLLLAFSPPAES